MGFFVFLLRELHSEVTLYNTTPPQIFQFAACHSSDSFNLQLAFMVSGVRVSNRDAIVRKQKLYLKPLKENGKKKVFLGVESSPFPFRADEISLDLWCHLFLLVRLL